MADEERSSAPSIRAKPGAKPTVAFTTRPTVRTTSMRTTTKTTVRTTTKVTTKRPSIGINGQTVNNIADVLTSGINAVGQVTNALGNLQCT
jgi:hypothetical protein